MVRLILLNGAPGAGKSTLARLYAERHPLTLALDLDVLRGMIGGWLEAPYDAGLLARAAALEAARAHLGAGHDVIVPQFLGRLDFALALDRLAAEVGVPFVEIALVTSEADTLARFAARTAAVGRVASDDVGPGTTPGAAASLDATHRDAAALLARSGGSDELVAMHRRFLEVVAARPATRRVDVVEGEVERAYADLVAHVRDAGDARAVRTGGGAENAPPEDVLGEDAPGDAAS